MSEILVRQAIERYLGDIRLTLKSYYSVASVLRVFEAHAVEKRLVDVGPADIHQYTLSRIKLGIKASTVNRELSVISAFANHAARRWGLPVINPVRYQWLKPSPLRLRYLSRDESLRLLEAADNLRPDLGAFVRLAIHTGCRKSELLTLQWADIHFDRRFLLLRPENTKSGKRRALPLNNTALQALQVLKQGNETRWVFARKGERIKALDWLFRKACRLASVDDFRIHDLRHTFASWMVSEGVDLVKVRDLLGHTSIKMTERYAHLMPDRLLSAVQVLDLFSESGQ